MSEAETANTARAAPAVSRQRPASRVGTLPAVRLVAASKSYGAVDAVQDVTLDIHQRELFTLLGPSGSGKTTILRMIAGLVQPSTGELWIGDEEVRTSAVYERNIAMVFQSLALFPHMTVFGNVAFPLRMRRVGRREIRRRVLRALDIVRLPDLSARRVNELSGGQQQRVALARALVYEPELLLLDEPLGALDRRLREEMQLEIVRLHQEIDVTIVNVTHDQREALMLSDRIGVMRAGRLEQVGPNVDLYTRPATRFVAEFLGDANLVEGTAATDGVRAFVTTASGAVLEVESLGAEEIGRKVAVVIRAEVLRVLPPDSRTERLNAFSGTVALRVFEGAAIYYEVDLPDLGTRFKISTRVGGAKELFEVGQPVLVAWQPSDAPLVPVDPQ